MKTANESKTKTKNGTKLNKFLRQDCGLNSRRFSDGSPIPVAAFQNKYGRLKERTLIDLEKAGFEFTTFNIQPAYVGSTAIRSIILNGNETTVIFADGDRVVLHRHESDADDPVTAVLWALGEKVFGRNLGRQISKALKSRGTTLEALRREKAIRKAEKDAKLLETLGIVNG